MRSTQLTRSFVRLSAGVLRAAFVLFLLLAGAFGRTVQAAEENAVAKLAAFGDTLLELEPFRRNSAPRTVTLNGLEIGLVTLSTSLDVNGALDGVETLCKKSGGVAGAEKELDLSSKHLADLRRLKDGVLRRQSPEQGVIACLDTGGKLELEELVDRMGEVQKTGDLGALGALRYAIARRGKTQTTLLVLWTKGSFPFVRAFPKDGDAPGVDPEGLPRPERSRRLISAREQGAPYRITVYAVRDRTPAALREYYRAELTRLGYAVDSAHETSLFARRGDRLTVIHVSAGDGGQTLANVAELS